MVMKAKARGAIQLGEFPFHGDVFSFRISFFRFMRTNDRRLPVPTTLYALTFHPWQLPEVLLRVRIRAVHIF